jgi:inorganic pyrophosphatase
MPDEEENFHPMEDDEEAAETILPDILEDAEVEEVKDEGRIDTEMSAEINVLFEKLREILFGELLYENKSYA